MNPPLVIGVGNPYRRDDGVGLAVLAALGYGIEATGEALELLGLMRDNDRVVLVDAMSVGAPAGTVSVLHCRDGRWDHPLPPSASTHGLGVGDALGLALALGWAPVDLHVIGIETADRGYGEGLSPAVGAAVPKAAQIARALTAPRPAGRPGHQPPP